MGTEILSWWGKFKLNLAHWYQYATVWVLSVWGLVEVYWQTMMTNEEHQAFYAAVPFGLGKMAPFIIFAISYLVAHGFPQPALEKKIDASAEKAVDKALSGPM